MILQRFGVARPHGGEASVAAGPFGPLFRPGAAPAPATISAAATNIQPALELSLRRRHRAFPLPHVGRQIPRPRLAVTDGRLVAIRGPYIAIMRTLHHGPPQRDRRK
jgi:hypothetical protein